MEAPPDDAKVVEGPATSSKGTMVHDKDEVVTSYVKRFAGLPSHIRILPPDGSLRPLLAIAGCPCAEEPCESGEHRDCTLEGVVVGLDFDQTLVLGAGLGAGAGGGGVKVRGGDETVNTLQTLWAGGARLAVVTAAPASPDNARLVAALLRRLHLAREFASAALDTAPLLALLRSFAPPSSADVARLEEDDDDDDEKKRPSPHKEPPVLTAPGGGSATATESVRVDMMAAVLSPANAASAATADQEEIGEAGHQRGGVEHSSRSLKQETKRVVALLAISTGRRPGDLASYRLAQVTGPNAGGWSALQSLAAHQERALCAVDCLATYVNLTAPRRARQPALPDRLLLSPDEEGGVLDEDQAARLLKEVLTEAGIDPQSPEARELFHDSAELVTLDGGVKIARYRHVMCARYNKPEALLDFVTRLGQPPKKVVFVDDNSDNVFNMFHFFASRQLEQLAAGKPVAETTSVISCWYPPPEGGKPEAHDPDLLVLLRRMATL